MPRNQCHVIQGVDDGTLQMDHHLQVVIILDIITLENAYLPIDDHVLGVKCPEHRLVVVHHLQVNVGYLIGVGNPDSSASVRFLVHKVVRFEDLPRTSSVVDNFHHDLGARLASATGELLHGIGEEFRGHRVLPVVGRQDNLPLSSDDNV